MLEIMVKPGPNSHKKKSYSRYSLNVICDKKNILISFNPPLVMDPFFSYTSAFWVVKFVTR